METFDQEALEDNQITFTPQLKFSLHKAALWSKRIGLVGMILYGLIAILLLGFGGTLLTTLYGAENAGMMGAIGSSAFSMIFMIASFAFAIYIFYLIWKFGTSTLKGLKDSSQVEVESGFSSLATVYQISGIIMFIFIGLYALIFLIALFAGVGSLM